MICKEIRSDLIELLGQGHANPVLASHAKSCTTCSRKLNSWHKILALLDDWTAPPPSSRFFSRLQNRIKNECQ